MSIFLDSCVILSIKNKKDVHHEKCKRFIEENKSDRFHITQRTFYESSRVFKEKLNKATMYVLAKTRSIQIDDDLKKNKKSLKKIFKELREQHSEIKNFLELVEDKSIEFLDQGYKDLFLLPEWVVELGDALVKNIEKLLGMEISRYYLTRIETDVKKQEKEKIKEMTAKIHFKDNFDESIFYELVVNRNQYDTIHFYTLDGEFIKKAKKAKDILMKNKIMKDEDILFFNLLEIFDET